MGAQSGLVPGGDATSHAGGNDILYKVEGSAKKYRLEGDEYHICAAARQSDEIIELRGVTAREILDHIYSVYGCHVRPGTLEAGDFIVCKAVVKDGRKRNITGTVNEILNILQAEKSCRVSEPCHVCDNMEHGGEVSHGGLSQGLTLDDIAAKHSVSVSELEKELEIGIPDEMKEHGLDRERATAIAMDHLVVNPYAYTKHNLMGDGGDVEKGEPLEKSHFNPDGTYTRIYYTVDYGSNDYDEIYRNKKYDDISKAKSDMGGIGPSDFKDPDSPYNHKYITRHVQTLKFVGDLDEDENISDYVDEDYLEDTDYWIVEDMDSDIVLSEKVLARNAKSDELLDELTTHFGTYAGYKTIDLDEDGNVTLKLRIKDHSGKRKNRGDDDYFLSIVIADHNKTSHFYSSSDDEGFSRDEEFEFDSDTDKREIIDFINMKIREFQEDAGIEGHEVVFAKGGEINKFAVCNASVAKTAGTPKRSQWGEGETQRYERCMEKVQAAPRMAKGGSVDFAPHDLPSRSAYEYAIFIKENYPKVWNSVGNVHGNSDFKMLSRVLERGYWLPSEEIDYIIWKEYKAIKKDVTTKDGVLCLLKRLAWPSCGEVKARAIIGIHEMSPVPQENVTDVDLMESGGEVAGASLKDVESTAKALEGVKANIRRANDMLVSDSEKVPEKQSVLPGNEVNFLDI